LLKTKLTHPDISLHSRDQIEDLKALEAENERLKKKLVAELSLDKAMLESIIEVVEKDYGIEVK